MAYVLNPKTGRQIQVGGRVHKQLMQQYGGAENTFSVTTQKGQDGKGYLVIKATGNIIAKAGDTVVEGPDNLGVIMIPLSEWTSDQYSAGFSDASNIFNKFSLGL